MKQLVSYSPECTKKSVIKIMAQVKAASFGQSIGYYPIENGIRYIWRIG
jgi:hypothetical protein